MWNQPLEYPSTSLLWNPSMFKSYRTFVFRKGALLTLLAVVLAGCEPKAVHAGQEKVDNADYKPSRPPTFDDLIKVTAPDYKTPRDGRSECFGRLMFDVTGTVEWPTYYRAGYPDALFNRSFEGNVADPSDNMRYGDTLIAVLSEAEGKEKGRVFEELPTAKLESLRQHIEESRAYIVRLKAKSKSTGIVSPEIAREEESILRWQNLMKDYQTKFELLDLGLPNTTAYWTSESSSGSESGRYSILRAYLSRNGHTFVFESAKEMKGSSDKAVHQRDFSAMLSKFRPRPAGEIPKERGVCIPFGFIADGGTTKIEFKQSLRFADSPGVLYTLNTGTVGPRNMKATPLLAATEAMINPPRAGNGNGTAFKVVQRIGPRIAKMGALPASQGGVVIKAKPPKGEAYDIYSVFTGYSGWLGTDVLPYILLNMHTVNREVATELPVPPPFVNSRDRMERILGSMRWRPTDPVMQEFIVK